MILIPETILHVVNLTDITNCAYNEEKSPIHGISLQPCITVINFNVYKINERLDWTYMLQWWRWTETGRARCWVAVTQSLSLSSLPQYSAPLYSESTITEFNINKQVQKINMYKFTWKWRSSFIFHATLKIQCTINYRYSLFLLNLNKSTYFFSIMWTYFLPKSK